MQPATQGGLTSCMHTTSTGAVLTMAAGCIFFNRNHELHDLQILLSIENSWFDYFMVYYVDERARLHEGALVQHDEKMRIGCCNEGRQQAVRRIACIVCNLEPRPSALCGRTTFFFLLPCNKQLSATQCLSELQNRTFKYILPTCFCSISIIIESSLRTHRCTMCMPSWAMNHFYIECIYNTISKLTWKSIFSYLLQLNSYKMHNLMKK